MSIWPMAWTGGGSASLGTGLALLLLATGLGLGLGLAPHWQREAEDLRAQRRAVLQPPVAGTPGASARPPARPATESEAGAGTGAPRAEPAALDRWAAWPPMHRLPVRLEALSAACQAQGAAVLSLLPEAPRALVPQPPAAPAAARRDGALAPQARRETAAALPPGTVHPAAVAAPLPVWLGEPQAVVVRMRLKTGYGALRACVEQALLADPAAALKSVRLDRDDAGAGGLAELSWQLYFRTAPWADPPTEPTTGTTTGASLQAATEGTLDPALDSAPGRSPDRIPDRAPDRPTGRLAAGLATPPAAGESPR